LREASSRTSGRSAQLPRKWSVRSDPVKEYLRGRAKSSGRLTLSARRTRIGLVCVGAPPVRGKGILPPKLVRGDLAEPSSSLYSADFRHDGGRVP
jgi:hypothetical protein